MLRKLHGAIVFVGAFLSPAASVVQENAASLFCCEAPEMFHGI